MQDDQKPDDKPEAAAQPAPRGTHAPSDKPSLTPASDSAARVIAAGQMAMADRLALRGADGVMARVCMALQNAYITAVSAEMDAGASKMDLHAASGRAIGCLISQSNGMIFADAPKPVRQAALAHTINEAASFALHVISGDGSSQSVVSERVHIDRAGAA